MHENSNLTKYHDDFYKGVFFYRFVRTQTPSKKHFLRWKNYLEISLWCQLEFIMVLVTIPSLRDWFLKLIVSRFAFTYRIRKPRVPNTRVIWSFCFFFTRTIYGIHLLKPYPISTIGSWNELSIFQFQFLAILDRPNI